MTSNWNKFYHWKTKGCTPWAKSYFTEHLVGASTQTSAGTLKIVSLDSFEGDVELGNRKGKLITIYDCAITLTWSDEEGEAKGTITFPEVSHEVEDEGTEYISEVALTSAGGKDGQSVLEGARRELVPAILPHLHSFREALIKEHAADIGHETPSAAGSTPDASSREQSSAPSGTASASHPQKTASVPKSASSKSSQTIRSSADLAIRREDLWELLTDPSRIPLWTKSPAKFNVAQGEEFSLFGGNVSGSITSAESPSHLAQKWRLSSWPEGHYAELTMQLEQESDSTKLSIELKGVPVGQEEASSSGLDNFYMRSLKSMGLATLL